MILFQNHQNIRHGLAICFRMFKDDFTGFYLFIGYTYNKQKNIMKNLSVLMVLFAVLFSSTTYAQKSKKLKYGIQVMVLDDFNPNSSITVFSSGKDPLGLRDLIEGELMFSSSQLKVISPASSIFYM